MSLLPSVKTYITVEGTRFRSAVSEFLIQTMGKTINYLIDKTDSIESVLEGSSFSFVQSVNAGGSYTVPADSTFVGIAWGRGNSATSNAITAITITNGSISGTFSSGNGSGATDVGFISVPQVVAAGVTLTVADAHSSTASVGISGFIFSTTTITIP